MKVVKSLYFQILFAVQLGVLVGHFCSQQAIALKPLGDAFIKLIKMMIAPVVCCTIVTGIAGMSDKRSLGRLLSKAMLLFLALTVVSLIIGLVSVARRAPSPSPKPRLGWPEGRETGVTGLG